MKKKDVTKRHASNYVATDQSHGWTQPARQGADRTISTLLKACHAHSEVMYMCQAGCMQHSVEDAHAAYRLGEGQGEPLAQPDLDDPHHPIPCNCNACGETPAPRFKGICQFLSTWLMDAGAHTVCSTLLVVSLPPT
jgi:hypothetical protein